MMNAEQKAAWLSERVGSLTASRMADAMSYKKDGSSTADRNKYMKEVLAERITGLSMTHYVTPAMEWGLEHEDEAVDLFVTKYPKYRVVPSRFYKHPLIENFGATPDREIDDGLMEVKCPTTATYIEWLMSGVVPEEYKPQMAAQLLCAGKAWCAFIAYDPRVREEKKRLIIRKYIPTEEYLKQVEAEAIKFLTELDTMFDQFVTAEA